MGFWFFQISKLYKHFPYLPPSSIFLSLFVSITHILARARVLKSIILIIMNTAVLQYNKPSIFLIISCTHAHDARAVHICVSFTIRKSYLVSSVILSVRRGKSVIRECPYCYWLCSAPKGNSVVRECPYCYRL